MVSATTTAASSSKAVHAPDMATDYYKKHADKPALVNRWNDFDRLEEVVVGTASGACFPPQEPGFTWAFQDQHSMMGAACGNNLSHPFSEYFPWPTGPKLQRFIDDANAELQGMVDVCEGEGVVVHRPDVTKTDFNKKVQTPDFEIVNQLACTCPRDVVVTIGNEILEAPMSKRVRYFEFRPYRSLLKHYFDNDPRMLWTAAPKPMMQDSVFRPEFANGSADFQEKEMGNFRYSLNDDEILFDAADILVLGQDIFVQQNHVTNTTAVRWLKRVYEPKGFNVQCLHFKYPSAPSHIDATFVPLRDGLCLVNPERTFCEDEVKMWKQNDWRFIECATYNKNMQQPLFCPSTRWLNQNVFQLDENKIVVEENEKDLIAQLEGEHGFDVIPLPYRKVYEFGGSLHCSTWDIRRTGGKKDYFPNREATEDVGLEKMTKLP